VAYNVYGLLQGWYFVFRLPTTTVDLFTNAEVNYKSSIFNVPLKLLSSIAFSRLLQFTASLAASPYVI
jgi:hypothetical protein